MTENYCYFKANSLSNLILYLENSIDYLGLWNFKAFHVRHSLCRPNHFDECVDKTVLMNVLHAALLAPIDF